MWRAVIVASMVLPGCTSVHKGEYEPTLAAGEHHLPIIDNDRVRVLDVRIAPGDTVPYHLHDMPSVFITLEPASLEFYDLEGNVVKRVQRDGSVDLPVVEWRGPAPAPRKVKNVDDVALRALRIELRK